MPFEEHEQNRKLWDEIVEIHYHHPDYKVKEFLQGWSSLKPIELAALGDVTGKHLLHLQCQFGMDTLSWARKGAIVTGVDISGKSIELANTLKRNAGLDAEFVCSDVVELIGKIDKLFDIVFQSHGTLNWLADLDKWAKVVAHYLKPGATFFIVDEHPISYLFLEEGVSYFDKQPRRYSHTPDYCDRTYVWQEDSVEWQHTLAEIINSLIHAGLIIERLDEYNKSYYAVEPDWYEQDSYFYPPGDPTPYPLLFSLKARKTEKRQGDDIKK